MRPDSGLTCTSASTSQVRVEVCARTPREARLAWWKLQPARSGNRNRLPPSPVDSGTFSCSRYRGFGSRESGNNRTRTQLRQAVLLRYTKAGVVRPGDPLATRGSSGHWHLRLMRFVPGLRVWGQTKIRARDVRRNCWRWGLNPRYHPWYWA